MNKTPVSLLQEMMVKKGKVPNYELIHDGGGSHMNKFIYQVTCDGLCASGTGRCKKDAKHEAAKAMLEVIAAHRAYPQLPASPAESPVRTPLPPKMPVSQRLPPDVPFVNAIGALQDLCSENNLQEPQYVPISDVGPPHAKVFTYHCIVSTFKEVGVATTKKQAKQDAAKKMLLKFKEIVKDMSDDDTSEAKENEQTVKKGNLGLKISERHKKLKHNFGEAMRVQTLTKLQDLISKEYEVCNESVVSIVSELENILSELKLELNMIALTAIHQQEDGMYLVAVLVDFTPNICEIGIGCTETETKLITLKKLINTLIIFLQ